MTPVVERVSGDQPTPWLNEHRSRYRFAQPIVEGARVLDIATGSGYGAEMMLVSGAASVVGVDVSREALKQAAERARPGLEFVRAEATALPFPNGSFGTAISFETLEHVADARAFVLELRRVLDPGGTLILSTPNALHTSSIPGVPRNPFHLHEYTPAELEGLLGRVFSSVVLLAQRPHPRYRPCPYWERPDLLPSDLAGRMRVVGWKLQRRLPEGLRERIAQRIQGRTFFPGDEDFVFESEDPGAGHVLVAICRI